MARRFKTADIETGVMWTADYRPSTHHQSSISPRKSTLPSKALTANLRTHSLDSNSSPLRHIRSPVPFDKQTPRPDITRMGLNANENRFNVIPEFSPIYSKTRKVCTPLMAKALPRKSSVPRRVNEVAYTPNYAAVWKKLTKTLHFDKALSRKKLAGPALDLVYEKISYKQVTPKVPSPNFQHTRQDSGPCELPIFMRGLTSWQAMHTLNEKMLRMNRFYPVTHEDLYMSTINSRKIHGRASSVGH